MKIKAGRHWELPIRVVGREGDIVTVNINNGAIFSVKMYNNIIMGMNYDGIGGPVVKDYGAVYIWNSKEKTQNGTKKMSFTINKKDLEEIINV